VDAMRYLRCGFGPDEGGVPHVSRPPYAHAYEVGGIQVDQCPAWYFSGELSRAVGDAFDDADADVQLSDASPNVLIEARAIIKRARRARGA
jgi:hypothetical protein